MRGDGWDDDSSARTEQWDDGWDSPRDDPWADDRRIDGEPESTHAIRRGLRYAAGGAIVVGALSLVMGAAQLVVGGGTSPGDAAAGDPGLARTAASSPDSTPLLSPPRTMRPGAPTQKATSTPTATPAPTPTHPTTAPPPPTPSPSPVVTPTPAPTGLAPIGPTEIAVVLRVVDGDTIEIERGLGPEKVRYIGVDTPETVHPSRPVERMGTEAAAANAALVDGREVLLEKDISETDHYGRLLRYVWVADGPSLTFVNLALVRDGFAQVDTYPPDVRWAETFLEAQRIARDAGRGLWGEESAAVAPEPVAPLPVAGGGCDASYPDVCIPPAPPDLDCGDISFRRFAVLAPDPHRFDGNHDGVGCERD